MVYQNDRPVPQVIRAELLEVPPPTNRGRDTSRHVNIPKASTAVAGRIGKAAFSHTVPPRLSTRMTASRVETPPGIANDVIATTVM